MTFFDPVKVNVVGYDPERHNEICSLIADGSIRGLQVNSLPNWKLESLEWLSDFPNIEYLDISSLERLNVEPIYGVRGLKGLAMWTRSSLNFARLSSLKFFAADWKTIKFEGLEGSCLESLMLRGYSSKRNDFSEIPSFKNLKDLAIIRSSVHSLYGLSDFISLRKVSLQLMPKLTDISSLSLPLLHDLMFENCKKIDSYTSLSKNEKLVTLKIHDCAPIDSLDFVRKLPALESFRFINTDVLNGDLSSLIGLDDVCFTQKKHFSHKLGDFKTR